MTGWDLIPVGGKAAILEVRRGSDNDEPLWRAFAVPPDSYDIRLHMKGMADPLAAGAGVEIKKGDLLVFDTGL